MLYMTVTSPIGTLTIAGDTTHIYGLHIEGDRYFTTIPTDWVYTPGNPIFESLRDQLEAYFRTERFTFDIPLIVKGTEFQELVWRQLLHISPGQTLTYAQLAAQIGKPKAIRAVGTAIGRNPLCILIPCHRVIASSGGLGGYVAGLNRKEYLLQIERQGS